MQQMLIVLFLFHLFDLLQCSSELSHMSNEKAIKEALVQIKQALNVPEKMSPYFYAYTDMYSATV